MRVLQNHDLHYAGHYGHVVLGARFKSQGFLHRTYRYQVHGVQTYHGMKQMQHRRVVTWLRHLEFFSLIRRLCDASFSQDFDS